MSTHTTPIIEKIARTFRFTLILVTFLVGGICNPDSQGAAFTYHWEIDETPEGSESATVIEPVEVTLLDERIQVVSHSASLALMRKYSVYLGIEWSPGHAYRLLQTFESIPQKTNSPYAESPEMDASLWRLSNRHIQNDISVEYRGGQRIITIAEAAFVHATPLLAEIEGVRGKYFSKRLHHAVVRFVTDSGADRYALERILQERYAVSVNVPDYSELTRHTTGEHAGRFSEFKNEELMALVSMLEEFPQGMITTPGLNYLVRRLDGTPHPLHPAAPAVAWPSAGYIEFMESAFKEQGPDYIHRLILHEKAHFLWEHLFNEELKQDWIELGGWFVNPEDKDGWSTTKQVEFVSAYAHGVNPNEDMAESISYYIVNPDKLRSRSPAKYEFIQNRVMHGARYISKIREDLTFEVYNLYPDYVYPGRITRIDIQVEGEPEEDKQITVEIEIHGESALDAAQAAYIRVFSEKGTFFDLAWMSPVDANGMHIASGHILRGQATLSRYAASGYWGPDAIRIWDAQGNERHESQTDFGWKLYIDNPLADCEPPEYVPNSMRLSLSKATTPDGRPYQIVTASWEVIEKSGIEFVYAVLNDKLRETHSIYRQSEYGGYDSELDRVVVNFKFPEYMPSDIYSLNGITMSDIALNKSSIYFTEGHIDEAPKTIEVKTKTPDLEPPVLDVNRITIKAEPTIPETPNGETIVNISFRIKDNISGYEISSMNLRDPHGVMHHFYHYPEGYGGLYFTGNPTLFKEYHQRIVLPVGSIPGTWGLAEMTVFDKAGNILRTDFTEIVRFEVGEEPIYTQYDVNQDGKVDNADLGLITASLGQSPPVNPRVDVDGSGTVDGNDLLLVIENFDESSDAAPSAIGVKITGLNRDQIQAQIDLLLSTNDNSLALQQTLVYLNNLLALVFPDSTQLLANYPNPFNPETWIPYQLATNSDVRIMIYNTTGIVVRILELGHQSAGYYTGRSRAVYWDGRNGLGEPVASGVYFYQLQTDNISPIRKMVILK